MSTSFEPEKTARPGADATAPGTDEILNESGAVSEKKVAIGVILAAFGAGALGGGIFAGTLGRLKRKGLIALLSALIMAASIALVPY